MKKVLYLISLIILSIVVVIIVIQKNEKQKAEGIVEFIGEGEYWDVIYTYDSDRHENNHANYFKLTYKEKVTLLIYRILILQSSLKIV